MGQGPEESCAQVLHSWKRCKLLAEIRQDDRFGGECSQSLQQAALNFLWLFWNDKYLQSSVKVFL